MHVASQNTFLSMYECVQKNLILLRRSPMIPNCQLSPNDPSINYSQYFLADHDGNIIFEILSPFYILYTKQNHDFLHLNTHGHVIRRTKKIKNNILFCSIIENI